MEILKIFEKEEFGKVRIVINKNGNILFCLSDVCKALDLSNPSHVKTRLKTNGIYLVNLSTLISNEGVIINELGNTMANFINESNLYKCVFQSRKKEAESFQDWIFEEVLPSIRKTGGYVSNSELFVESYFPEIDVTAKQFLIQTLDSKKALIEQSKKQEELIKIQTPKVESFEEMISSDTLFSMQESANVLGYGRNKFMALLRGLSILQKNNIAYRKYIDAGYFQKKIRPVNGINHTTTFVTSKGIEYLRKKIKRKLEWKV